MRFEQEEPYHVYNRGNQKQPIFFNNDNYIFFQKKIKDQLLPVSEIVAYCLMPNHFHLLLQPTGNGLFERKTFGGKFMQELSYRIGILTSSYCQAINKQNNWVGSLFQQKTKSKLLTTYVNDWGISYFEQCFHYIHKNPVVAGLVTDPRDWPFSSYIDYVDAGRESFCNRKLFTTVTGIPLNEIGRLTMMDSDERMLEKIF